MTYLVFATFIIVGLVIAAGAWFAAEAMTPQRSLQEKCDEAVRDHIKATLPGVVMEVLREPQFKWFWFVKEMQWEMMRVDKSLSGKRAWELAINAYRENLRDEKISFGDPRYDWTKSGAIDLIHSYEIDHWEAA